MSRETNMRNKLISLLVPIVLAFGLISMPVKATEWDVAIGVKAISGDVDSSGSEHEFDTAVVGKTTPEVNTATHSESVEVGSIFLEFAARDGAFGLTTGFEHLPGSASIGSKARTDTDLSGGSEGGASATYTAKAEVEDVTTFYIDPTIYFGNFGIYGKAGATILDLNTLETIDSGTNSSTYPNKRVAGGVLGGGIRYLHPSGLLVKLEYQETNFRPIKLQSTTGNKNMIKAEIDYTSTSLAIGWQF